MENEVMNANLERRLYQIKKKIAEKMRLQKILNWKSTRLNSSHNFISYYFVFYYFTFFFFFFCIFLYFNFFFFFFFEFYSKYFQVIYYVTFKIKKERIC